MTVERSTDRHTPIPTAELQLRLEEVLAKYYGEPVGIAEIARQPSAYRSSFALEALEIDLGRRGMLSVMFKDLSWHALTAEARLAKQRSSYDPLREIRIYEDILRSYPGYGAACYGSLVDPSQNRYWLFIEHIGGQELYQIGEFAVFEEVARWLAKMHNAFQPLIEQTTDLRARLITHGAEQQKQRLRRACAAAARRGHLDKSRSLLQLSKALPGMAAALSAAPPTLIHGEFYPSNILVISSGTQRRVCAIDWEMAGLGTGLLDLAALVVGRWTEQQQQAIARAYYQTMRGYDRERDFFRTLDYCRLYIALGWLGCSDSWIAPAAHVHDWFNEAMSANERLAVGAS